ncbi:MAG: winged helix-turn-helix domain-containing protein [Actinomycetota bacterium]|nr:winged helix-turn-helix domain-containing protein [Actinomycetota bacterium]
MNAEAYVDAVLAALHNLGGSATNTELLQRVADDLGLSEEDRTRPHGDGSVTWLYYRLAWARTRLRMDGIIRNAGRGQWAFAAHPMAEPPARRRPLGSLGSQAHPAAAAPITVPVDIQQMTLPELLWMSRAVLRELVNRNVLRSMNAPAGDLAEWLMTSLLGGKLEPTSQKGWDLTYRRDGEQTVRVQVKARVVANPNDPGQRQLSVFRSLDFDELAIVLFNGDLGIWTSVLLPVGALKGLMRRSEYVNGDRLMAADRLLADVDELGGRDLTEDARQFLAGL